MAMKKYTWRIIGYVFKAICALIIAAVVGLLIWRIADSRTDPQAVKQIMVNNALHEAYEKNDGDLNLFYQEQSKFTQAEDNYGYFAVTQSCFIDEAEQLQVVLRYNNSTLKYLSEDYSLTEIPSRDSQVFDVTVLVAYDLTPEDTSDNFGNDEGSVRFERFFASAELSHKKTLYNYRKLTFDGIKIDKSVLAVYLDIYYTGDVNYEDEPYGTLLLYDHTAENVDYKLTAKDKALIEEYGD